MLVAAFRFTGDRRSASNRRVSANDTIFALSSGRPPAAIAVVRISGPRAGDALKALTGRLPAPRQAALARVRDPATSEIIDEALALWFPGPNSETGEDTAELQLHGGRAVIAGVLAALSRISGLRPAEAGEFTRRAFENGKLDLTAVEGPRRSDRRGDAGAAPPGVPPAQGPARRARRDLAAAADRGAGAGRGADRLFRRGRCAGGFSCACNQCCAAIAQRDRRSARRCRARRAIARRSGGGDRRTAERRQVDLAQPHRQARGGDRVAAARHHPRRDRGASRSRRAIRLRLLDTAGIRDSDDPVEQEGVRRARERAAAADLVLWVVDAAEPGVELGRLWRPIRRRGWWSTRSIE